MDLFLVRLFGKRQQRGYNMTAIRNGKMTTGSGTNAISIADVRNSGLTVGTIEVTSGTTVMQPNVAYFANSSSQLTFRLPATINAGDEFMIIGKGAGGFLLTTNASSASQQIAYQNNTNIASSSSVVNLVVNQNRYDSFTLKAYSNSLLMVKQNTGCIIYADLPVPSYINVYWPMNNTSGNEPSVKDTSWTFTQNGTVGYVSPAKAYTNARGMYSASDYFTAVGSNTTETIFSYYDSFIVDGWFKTSAPSGTYSNIISKGDATYGWIIQMMQNGTIRIYLNAYNMTTAGTYHDSNWHFFTWANLGVSEHYLYIDGTLVISDTGSHGRTDSGRYLYVGYQDVAQGPLNGYVGDISFGSNFSLTQAQAAAYHAARYNSGIGAKLY